MPAGRPTEEIKYADIIELSDLPGIKEAVNEFCDCCGKVVEFKKVEEYYLTNGHFTIKKENYWCVECSFQIQKTRFVD